jgi:hypothetical protein
MVVLFRDIEGQQLIEAIEILRMEMIVLSEQFGLSHPTVQKCSEKLDRLLLEYYMIHK